MKREEKNDRMKERERENILINESEGSKPGEGGAGIDVIDMGVAGKAPEMRGTKPAAGGKSGRPLNVSLIPTLSSDSNASSRLSSGLWATVGTK